MSDKRISWATEAVGIPNSTTDNELRQDAIFLLDNGRVDDIITGVRRRIVTANGRELLKVEIEYLLPKPKVL